jgi:hypothetical protein
MDKRPSQVSFYLAILCLTLSICAFAVVVGFLFQKWNTRPSGDTVSKQEDTTNQVVPDDDAIDRYEMKDLEPELGEYLVAHLDEQRVRVAQPKQWPPRPRSNEYLVRFDTRVVDLPRITVTVEEADFDEPRTVSEENLADFVKLVQASIPEADSQRMLEPVKPMMLGDKPAARYVMESKPTRFKRTESARTYERQILKTLHEGRIYAVTLDVFSGTIQQYRKKGYAVLAGLQFVGPDEQEVAEQP